MWFNNQDEEAANYMFRFSKILKLTKLVIMGMRPGPKGSVMTVTF